MDTIDINREVDENLFHNGIDEGSGKPEINELQNEGYDFRLKILKDLEDDVMDAKILFDDIKVCVITSISSINSIDKPLNRPTPKGLADNTPREMLEVLVTIEERLYSADTDTRQSRKASEVLPTVKKCFNEIRDYLKEIQTKIESKWLRSKPRVDAKMVATLNAVKITLDNIKTLRMQ